MFIAAFMNMTPVGSKYEPVGCCGRKWGMCVISPVLLSCLAHTRVAHRFCMMSHSLTPIYSLTEWYVIHITGTWASVIHGPLDLLALSLLALSYAEIGIVMPSSMWQSLDTYHLHRFLLFNQSTNDVFCLSVM